MLSLSLGTRDVATMWVATLLGISLTFSLVWCLLLPSFLNKGHAFRLNLLESSFFPQSSSIFVVWLHLNCAVRNFSILVFVVSSIKFSHFSSYRGTYFSRHPLDIVFIVVVITAPTNLLYFHCWSYPITQQKLLSLLFWRSTEFRQKTSFWSRLAIWAIWQYFT